MRWQKNKVFLVFGLVWLLLSVSCKKEALPKVTNKVYKKEFKQARQAIEDLAKLTHSSSMSQEKYLTLSEPRLEKARIFINKYKSSDVAIELDSFRALKLAEEHYRVAHELWNQNKGLILVSDRWRMGAKMLDKASEAYLEEVGNVEEEGEKKKGGGH